MAHMHRQRFVKVNTNVDEGVSDLVEGLSMFPRLCTVSSCEGPPATIFFRYGEDWTAKSYREVAEFVLGRLGPHMAKRAGDGVRLSVGVDSTGAPSCEMVVLDGAMVVATNAVKELHGLCQRGTP